MLHKPSSGKHLMFKSFEEFIKKENVSQTLFSETSDVQIFCGIYSKSKMPSSTRHKGKYVRNLLRNLLKTKNASQTFLSETSDVQIF